MHTGRLHQIIPPPSLVNARALNLQARTHIYRYTGTHTHPHTHLHTHTYLSPQTPPLFKSYDVSEVLLGVGAINHMASCKPHISGATAAIMYIILPMSLCSAELCISIPSWFKWSETGIKHRTSLLAMSAVEHLTKQPDWILSPDASIFIGTFLF